MQGQQKARFRTKHRRIPQKQLRIRILAYAGYPAYDGVDTQALSRRRIHIICITIRALLGAIFLSGVHFHARRSIVNPTSRDTTSATYITPANCSSITKARACGCSGTTSLNPTPDSKLKLR